MKNYKLIISFDGSRYNGWEHQPEQDTIQGRIEKAVFEVCGKHPDVNGAGRTDAGVHAKRMVANVRMDVPYTDEQIRDMLNKALPEDIAVLEVRTASDNFHARYSAVGKTYSYTCYAGEYSPVFRRKYVTILDKMPDIGKMKKAAKYMTGKNDFASFCREASSYKSTIRVVDKLDIVADDKGYITFTFHGTGFMRNMVRIMVGTLLDVGFGRIKVEDIPKIMEARNREKAGYTAKAMGLCLEQVDY